MLKLYTKITIVVFRLLVLLKAGALTAEGFGALQTPLDSVLPNGPIPFPLANRIHPGLTHPNKCVDVRGAVFANGTPVQM